ncbi:MAG: Gfo/Idh/MocA family protein [Thermodesulfobacteriota bacterium]
MFLKSHSPNTPSATLSSETLQIRPKLGFLGVGWIGRHRMEAVAESGLAQVSAIADPVAESAQTAAQSVPGTRIVPKMANLLAEDIDGVVIATPSALHADQSIAALEAGKAVFCQKPLGRNAAEARAVISAARKADRLLGVDLCYRHVHAFREIQHRIRAGEIGTIYGVDLIFHNAYGPDKDWYYNPAEAGGGCVIDLGIHLVDFLLWSLDFPEVDRVTSRLFKKGRPVQGDRREVEDYAVARIDFGGGPSAALACSWGLQAGRDAVISAAFYGTEGGLKLTNVNGSFYDFQAELYRGTSREVLCEPPDAWGGRAAVAWAEQLSRSARFNPAIEEMIPVSEVLDAVYECN